MAGRVKGSVYLIYVMLGQVVFIALSGIALYFNREAIPVISGIDFAPTELVSAANSLNGGLIFALFLAIFMMTNSKNINDARSHRAFLQPVAMVLANSFLLCSLALLNPLERWLNVLVVICAFLLLLVNTKYTWDMLTLSRDTQKRKSVR